MSGVGVGRLGVTGAGLPPPAKGASCPPPATGGVGAGAGAGAGAGIGRSREQPARAMATIRPIWERRWCMGLLRFLEPSWQHGRRRTTGTGIAAILGGGGAGGQGRSGWSETGWVTSLPLQRRQPGRVPPAENERRQRQQER